MEPGTNAQARSVLDRYGLGSADLSPISVGLINLTYLVELDARRFILQRVNPAFPAEIHDDIAAVTTTLAEHGLATPRLIPNGNQQLCTQVNGEIWRVLSYMQGRTVEMIADPGAAYSAGTVLARFHSAIWGLDHTFCTPRLGVHDTPRQLQGLRDTLNGQISHPRYHDVAPLAERVLDFAAALPTLPQLPDRFVHGDPKISNVIFEQDSNIAICLVDLDTLGPMPLPFELGDAFRSWCNPHGEDTDASHFAMALFEAAIEGYAAHAPSEISPSEWRAIVSATEIIFTELAARFCADALNEAYFGWDPDRFDSHSEHNRIRAAGQLSAAASLRAQRKAASSVIEKYAPVMKG